MNNTNMKTLLGKHHWLAKKHKNSAVSTSILSGDPELPITATSEEVKNYFNQPDRTFNGELNYNFVYCEQYQKVGRSIKRVKIKEYNLTENN